jgi:hypothetical protein
MDFENPIPGGDIPGVYVLWIVGLTSMYEDKISAGLIKNGFMVNSIMPGSEISLQTDNSPSCVMSFMIADGKSSSQETYDAVISILTEQKIYYHAVIVSPFSSAGGGSKWCASNISLPRKQTSSTTSVDYSPKPTIKKINGMN